MTTVRDVAWLAGLMDGEGSVGFVVESRRARSISPVVQLSMTCLPTVKRAGQIVDEITGRGTTAYSYRERNDRHKDSHYLRMRGGVTAILTLGRALVDDSTTKRKHWELVIEFCESRITLCGVDDSGRLRRGGHKKVPYTQRELDIYKEMVGLMGNQPGRTGGKLHHDWIWQGEYEVHAG